MKNLADLSAPIWDDYASEFWRDGAVLIRGLFNDWVEVIKAGIEKNIAAPGPHSTRYSGDSKWLFFDDYCNWQRISEYEDFIRNSGAAEVAANIMRSSYAQFFHEHVLVKEPGASKPTPWHQDQPYYFLSGNKAVSFWIPVDAVPIQTSLKFCPGSHRSARLTRPTHWDDHSDFYTNSDEFAPALHSESALESDQLLSWAMEAGDAVLFHFRTLHAASGNPYSTRRRVLSLRWLGDDVRYLERGVTSPPFPGHGMKRGERLRQDWFPVLYRA